MLAPWDNYISTGLETRDLNQYFVFVYERPFPCFEFPYEFPYRQTSFTEVIVPALSKNVAQKTNFYEAII
jgi:hypothetical protein